MRKPSMHNPSQASCAAQRCPVAPATPIAPGRDQALEARRHRETLARLLPLWPHELADDSAAGRARRVALLQRALRAERRNGLAGHWTYDLARHRGLLTCYRRETADLARSTAD